MPTLSVISFTVSVPPNCGARCIRFCPIDSYHIGQKFLPFHVTAMLPFLPFVTYHRRNPDVTVIPSFSIIIRRLFQDPTAGRSQLLFHQPIDSLPSYALISHRIVFQNSQQRFRKMKLSIHHRRLLKTHEYCLNYTRLGELFPLNKILCCQERGLQRRWSIPQQGDVCSMQTDITVTHHFP